MPKDAGGKRKGRKGRRARGTGSIFYSEPLGKWVGRKPVGKTAAGKTQYLTRQGATQAEVVKKLAAAAAAGPQTTVAEWGERWLAAHPGGESTRHSYAKSLAHIKEHLGGLRVAEVTPGRVEAFAKAIGGPRADGKLGPNTVRKVLSELRNMLSAAEREGLIGRNPVKLARKPKGVRRAIDPFTPGELAALVAGCDTPALAPVGLLAATGMRSGEALGLDVGDFDPAAGTVSVRRTFDREHGARRPKSPQSVRTIRVPSQALPCLGLAVGGRAAGPLFASASGNRRILELVRQSWVGLLARLGLPHKNLHQLRHSVATAMIAAGDPLGDVAKYLGDTVETVVKTYLHPTGADPAATIERLLGGGKAGDGKVGVR